MSSGDSDDEFKLDDNEQIREEQEEMEYEEKNSKITKGLVTEREIVELLEPFQINSSIPITLSEGKKLIKKEGDDQEGKEGNSSLFISPNSTSNSILTPITIDNQRKLEEIRDNIQKISNGLGSRNSIQLSLEQKNQINHQAKSHVQLLLQQLAISNEIVDGQYSSLVSIKLLVRRGKFKSLKV